MDKIHSSDLVFSFVRPKFRLLESWNDWIEYNDYDFWILIRVVERLKVFDDLEKLFCIACKVIFLALWWGGDDPSLQLVNVMRTCLGS